MSKMYDIPRAVGDRILLEVEIDDEKAVKSDFIVIPDSVNEDYNKRVLLSTNIGKVVQLGEVALESGILSKKAEEVMPGHLVLFLQNAGVAFKHKDEHKVYRLLTRGDIMAVVGEE